MVGGERGGGGIEFFFFSSRRRHTRLQGDWSSDVCSSDLDRPNLVFCVERVRDDRERFARMRELICGVDGPVIVYTPTRRLTELVARALLRLGVRAAPYHAGLAARTRCQVLRAFLADRAPVVVATSAFGMGIDKPDVRRVLHWGPPRTVEAYYQEAGRARPHGPPAGRGLGWGPPRLQGGGNPAGQRT